MSSQNNLLDISVSQGGKMGDLKLAPSQHAVLRKYRI